MSFFLWSIHSNVAIAEVCKQQQSSKDPQSSIGYPCRSTHFTAIQLILDRRIRIFVPLLHTMERLSGKIRCFDCSNGQVVDRRMLEHKSVGNIISITEKSTAANNA